MKRLPAMTMLTPLLLAQEEATEGQIDPASPTLVLAVVGVLGFLVLWWSLRRLTPQETAETADDSPHALDRDQFEAVVLADAEQEEGSEDQASEAEDDEEEVEPAQPILVEFWSDELDWPLFSEAVAEVAADHEDDFDFYRAEISGFQDLFRRWEDERYFTAMYSFDEAPFVALFHEGELVTTFHAHEQPGAQPAMSDALKRQVRNFLTKMEIIAEDA